MNAACARIPAADKARLRVMLLAKHARGDGSLHPVDGNHAVYHAELRDTLLRAGLNVITENRYEALFDPPGVDFVIPLLNRGGFLNSEMLAPLLLTRHRIPFLGASPILRGLADDKHLAKMAARHRGVPTADWRVFRQGGDFAAEPLGAPRLVVKPNASSASWGVTVVEDWNAALIQVEALHQQGHDAIVEPWTPRFDVAVPVIAGAGAEPWLLPAMTYAPADPDSLRGYEEKRSLAGTVVDDHLVPAAPALAERLAAMTRELARDYWPFDYGRFEFRFDPATGALLFMEVNLSCNLWSRKSISRSAASIGIAHQELVESIVAHSLARQGLIDAGRRRLVA
jgi:D-alanine-D-alanine ligase